jgi:hypothetical protein
VPRAETKKLVVSDADQWLNRFIIALALFVPTLVSAFIFIQIPVVERSYMQPVWRGMLPFFKFFIFWGFFFHFHFFFFCIC